MPILLPQTAKYAIKIGLHGSKLWKSVHANNVMRSFNPVKMPFSISLSIMCDMKKKKENGSVSFWKANTSSESKKKTLQFLQTFSTFFFFF